MNYAVLIDAGFIKMRLGSSASPLSAVGVEAFLASLRGRPELQGMRLHRIYWYDAPPLTMKVTKPLQGGDIHFGQSHLGAANALLLAELAKLSFVSLRLGNCTFRGWKVRRNRLPPNLANVILGAADIEPSIHQKAVDMRLGLDIASLTLKRHAQVIVLVTGDSDFVPAMKFARREGAQVFLVALGHSVRQEMLEHSDLRLDVPFTAPPVTSGLSSVQQASPMPSPRP